MINGDDFYGAGSFRLLAEHLKSGSGDYAMVGFTLRNTLSEFGSVARGVCHSDASGFLKTVTELTKIEKDGRAAKYTDGEGHTHSLTGDEIASLNMWGFTPTIFGHLHSEFAEFLKKRGQDEKAEYFIPTVVDTLIQAGKARVKVLRTPDSWFGVTYREDRPVVAANIRQLVARGDYPERLWK
jgi:hypothetical protein